MLDRVPIYFRLPRHEREFVDVARLVQQESQNEFLRRAVLERACRVLERAERAASADDTP